MAKVTFCIPTDHDKWSLRGGRFVIQDPKVAPVAVVVGSGWGNIKEGMNKSFKGYLDSKMAGGK